MTLDRLVFAPSIVEKLLSKNPPVTVTEVEEAFNQWNGFWVLDDALEMEIEIYEQKAKRHRFN